MHSPNFSIGQIEKYNLDPNKNKDLAVKRFKRPPYPGLFTPKEENVNDKERPIASVLPDQRA